MKNTPLSSSNITQLATLFVANHRSLVVASIVISAAALTSCASVPSAAESLETIKASFAERGLAKLDRLDQTEVQKVCSQAAMTGQEVTVDTRERLQKTLYESIPHPKDGKFIGDWKEGEKIAQNGRGLQFSDVPGVANGANCYACHQLTPQEISWGNQGPSLLKYGSNRGVKDPNSKDSEAMVKYTWARIWNTHSVNLCSNMPRFGDAGILTTEQIKHVMALLLDPASPVNK